MKVYENHGQLGYATISDVENYIRYERCAKDGWIFECTDPERIVYGYFYCDDSAFEHFARTCIPLVKVTTTLTYDFSPRFTGVLR